MNQLSSRQVEIVVVITEETVVHEFAALCLSSLANDYSCKVTINEQDGLEPLIRCLGSHDPDVQKNAVETISLMLQVITSVVCYISQLVSDCKVTCYFKVIIEDNYLTNHLEKLF